MKKSILILALLCSTITTLIAQEIAPSNNIYGASVQLNYEL
jgi:hypothetical protein